MLPPASMLIIKIWARKNIFFMALLAMALGGCMPKGPKALLQGQKLIERGEYVEAVEKLQIATSLISTNAAAWNYLGLAYHHTGLATNAEQAYLKALALDRNLVEAHYNLGCLRLEENHLEGAKSELIVYTSLHSSSLEGWLKLAATQLRLRELTSAEKSFSEALKLDQKNAEALNGLGVIQLQRRDVTGAARLFNGVLKESPDYAPAILNLAIVNQNFLNNKPAALDLYRQYLASPTHPENWEAVNATARALELELNPGMGSRQSAGSASTALPVPPANVASRTGQVQPKPEPASTLTRSTQSTSATSEVARVQPDTTAKPAQDGASTKAAATRTDVSRQTAATTTKTNKPGFLNQLFHRQAKTNPPSTPAAGSVTSVSAAAPDPAASFPRYQYRNPAKPAAGNRSAAERFFAQGSQAQQANRYEDAIQFYRQAVQSDPAYFEAYYNCGLAEAARGNVSQALTAYETALAIRPDSLDARLNFAVVLKQANYAVDCARELEKLTEKNPSDARPHVILGNLYAQSMKQPAKAKEHYQKALDLDPRTPQASAIRYWLSTH
jgi:Flp pilus assembly protein TadD